MIRRGNLVPWARRQYWRMYGNDTAMLSRCNWPSWPERLWIRMFG